VSHIIDQNGGVVYENRPQLVRRAISEETSDWVRQELEQTVLAGTGRLSRIPGHTIGGKTGTAQHGAQRELVSIGYWIFTPVENPEFLIYAVIENVEHGRTAGNTLAPILRRFLEEVIIIRSLPPSEGAYVEDWQSPVLGLEPMPDFTDQRVNDVVRNLVNLGLAFQIRGGGTVVTSHFPAPGRTRPQPGSIPVQLHTHPSTYIPGGMAVMPNVVGLTATQALDFVRDATFVPHWWGGTGELANYEVYRQYPAPGTEAEQGMDVMLRVRVRN
jgi:stage V sporulation protein D (sporulation-specific penicillin-binding protein)